MIWVKWNSIDEFNIWHNAIKSELGLPKLSVDANGAEIEGSLVITDYVIPLIITDNDIRCCIDEKYQEGLEVSSNPIANNYEA